MPPLSLGINSPRPARGHTHTADCAPRPLMRGQTWPHPHLGAGMPAPDSCRHPKALSLNAAQPVPAELGSDRPKVDGDADHRRHQQLRRRRDRRRHLREPGLSGQRKPPAAVETNEDIIEHEVTCRVAPKVERVRGRMTSVTGTGGFIKICILSPTARCWSRRPSVCGRETDSQSPSKHFLDQRQPSRGPPSRDKVDKASLEASVSQCVHTCVASRVLPSPPLSVTRVWAFLCFLE